MQTSSTIREEPESEKTESSDEAAQVQTEAKADTVEPGSTTMSKRGFSWQNQNHSVLLLGWGFDKETNTKYWIVRNSYANKWGMNGDFLLRRGQNDFGVEADVVSFEPALCGDGSGKEC